MTERRGAEENVDGYILIVDDDEDIRNMLGIYLENEGFHFIKCRNADEAIQTLEDHKIDLILLDIMMPGINGLEACMKIRETSKIPIIFMSAKSEEMDKIQGLTVGADDYIGKPFHALELIARVKAQLRRYRQYNDGNRTDVIQYKDLLLNRESRQVWLDGREVRLTPKEFDILELLLLNKGITLSAKRIYEKVWREEFIANDKTVLTHISNLREKIEKDPEENHYIKTVWGTGYRI